ncbi:16S rRNA (guanine(966)-N(2))-methyltransferase RsmD [Mesoplasma lactucae]|uniref:16S rRNA (Guanine(966)-N(2))-methyltransferase RsmD n=1 Tax=Mesoplasma lactucae ATCC 49193 TaxID=81460 RepID=A0A291IRH5_9MOLU|nr:16S rRNA (guanine(966)-N(2))-methyltransferase RsmD [Mesoplasma lactucae]ATG97545.1 16S rRNA (guanine(966)-N(2))-methyltransferase RsmD [Mesoplasma lactucae ATCC 49193]ATZ19997.1 16S rRNA (guanine966-N2)-methyltransferase [Mesoplasma lactucae ATCC 49193]MCL8217052.1 Ribosomal RNA small subunit methyltransferase D [Mesoplasma lactucae ATCC 49193]
MNVISGKYKRRQLKTLPSMKTRPTTARVKEDMFNMLNNYFIYENKTSLDLFAGSGALSIEGLSRGIKKAYINDLNPEAIEVIKENLKNIPKEDYVLTQKDYLDVLHDLANRNEKVDLIYLDPPFPHIEYYYNFFETINELNILNLWGIIVVEAPEPLDLTQVKDLTLLREKHVKSKVDKYIYILRLEEKA